MGDANPGHCVLAAFTPRALTTPGESAAMETTAAPEDTEAEYLEASLAYDPPKELLERALTPKQVADLFYGAVFNCDMDVWLATLCDELKVNPLPPAPGAFALTGWCGPAPRPSSHHALTPVLLFRAVGKLFVEPAGALPVPVSDTPVYRACLYRQFSSGKKQFYRRPRQQLLPLCAAAV
jgi:hypothetical protein